MRQVALLACAVLSAVCSFAGELNHKQIPATSAWIAHVDFETFRSTQIGQLIIDDITKKHQDKIAALQELLGGNLLTDIQSLTLYGSDAKEEHAVSLIKGRFNKDKLLAFLKPNPAYAEIPSGSLTIYKWFDDKRQKEQFGAFAAVDLIVIGQTQSTLQTALDVLAQKQPALADQSQLSLFSLSQAPEGAFIIAAAEGLSKLADQEHAAILKNSNFVVFITSEQAGLLKAHLQLESETEESAVQIEQVVRGILAFATLQMKDQPQLQKIVQSGIVNRTGKNLQFDFSAPSGELFQLLKALEASKAGQSTETQPSPS